MPFFDHAGLRFNYLDLGQGVPFVFQHGLGASVQQPLDLYLPQPGFRFISMDCRAHGETRPLGDPRRLRFDTFADDLLALLDALAVPQAVVGGVSMGAGLALNFALRYPARTLGLVLSRPAWLDRPLPDNLLSLPRIAHYLRQFGPEAGFEQYQANEGWDALVAASPDTADSVARQFADAWAVEAVARLEQIPNDVPNRDRAEWAAIRVPTLVLANRQDPVHVFEYGQVLARAIPGAEFKELTAKSVSRDRYRLESQTTLADFLRAHFGE